MELFNRSNWTRTATLRFSEIIQPLHEMLEYQCQKNKSYKKLRVNNIQVSECGY